MTDSRTSDIARGLLSAALWTDCLPPEGSGENAETGGRQHLEPTARLRGAFKLAAVALVEATGEGDLDAYGELRAYDPSEGTVWDYFGHDAWLSATGAGSGFWDRDLGALGDVLDDVAKRTLNTDLLTPHAEDDETADLGIRPGPVWVDNDGDEHDCLATLVAEGGDAPGSEWGTYVWRWAPVAVALFDIHTASGAEPSRDLLDGCAGDVVNSRDGVARALHLHGTDAQRALLDR
jgi:hypothetical protein